MWSKAKLSGWGNYPVHETLLAKPESPAHLVLEGPLVARGRGKSYGDAALNPDGRTIATDRWDRLLDFNPESGLLRCEAGTTLENIIQHFLAKGWFIPVTPGTRLVSVGGAFACDVHGKNHHQDGSFASHVKRIRLLLADGTSRWCDHKDDLFWATAGGMGLTGIICEVELNLLPVETSKISQQTYVASNLRHMLELFREHDTDYTYSVAWIDCVAGGDKLGRGILMLGEHAGVSEVQALAPPSRRQVTVPDVVPPGILNKLTISGFNELYYRLQSRKKGRSLVDIGTFFHPLDSVSDWNRLYGKRGFVQYQFVVAEEYAEEVVTAVLNRCRENHANSFLSVIKRFGAQAPGPTLSFPVPGVTLTLDLPVRSGLLSFLDELDSIILAAGGRVYLAKDARLSESSFKAMYPEFEAWSKVKKKVDPEGIFSSALSRRLGMR